MRDYSAAVLTISDKVAWGEQVDTSGPSLVRILEGAGYRVVHTAALPDEAAQIQEELIRCADEKQVSLVLTTGGTGFLPRDVTPEATLSVIQRAVPGIPEAMRAESMRITQRGCLSRAVAGIRGNTLIVNLPGSEKASRENLGAVLGAIGHGLDMLCSQSSVDCTAPASGATPPSVDTWLREAKALEQAGKIGMYLLHNGVVRETARAQVRGASGISRQVSGMRFSYDAKKVQEAVDAARCLPGIYHVRVWLNRGELQVGDELMLVLVGGDIRPHVIAALESLVSALKTGCVTEEEL